MTALKEIELDRLPALLVDGMGVKEVYLGDTLLYTRPGGYFYLTLQTNDNEKET